ncbi:MAG: lysophospholipid acyltransferase family protein [Thermodesulfobacteriota bacterium]|nr:lysophospholipid acyltransferase family protein [Thermodesulfobacteriota bacterium]
MVTDILYRCPVCGSFDWFSGDKCNACNARVSLVSRSQCLVNGEKRSISDLYQKIRSMDLPVDKDGQILKSRRVKYSIEEGTRTFRGFAGIVATLYERKPHDTGTLILGRDSLEFSGASGPLTISIAHITSVTIETNTIIIVTKGDHVHFFDFLEESGKKWEDCIQSAISGYHAPRKILEFCPGLLFEDRQKTTRKQKKQHPEIRVSAQKGYSWEHSIVFALLRIIFRPVFKYLLRIQIKGLENVPEKGPAIIMANHTSFLDSLMLGIFPKRHIWYMGKNSQFSGWFFPWFLRIARAFPVRRYLHDPQAIRNAIRIVEQGHILGVFPEGERSWDNHMLPFKQGTMRLVLALGLPVIPVGISGGYDLMPRWTSRIKPTPVRINIGAPVLFEHIPLSMQTQGDIDRVGSRLRAKIISLQETNQ